MDTMRWSICPRRRDIQIRSFVPELSCEGGEGDYNGKCLVALFYSTFPDKGDELDTEDVVCGCYCLEKSLRKQ